MSTGYVLPWHITFACALSDIGPDWVELVYGQTKGESDTFDRHRLPNQHDTTFTKRQFDSFMALLAKQPNLRKYYSIPFISVDTNWTDAASLTMFDIEYSLTGYGYDMSQVTVKLSVVILALYAFIVVIYLSYTVISGRSGTSWDSIGELFMLCLNSKQPSHLQGTSAGVETLATYGKLMNVRINEARSAEIVFADDPALNKTEYSLVDVNKKYY